MKVALGFAVLAFGGTALAARTGSLPSAVQERAHTIFSDVGVPAPAPGASTQVTRGGVPTSGVPSPTPARSRTGSPKPSEPATLAHCRVWDVARQDPPGKAVPAQTRRALAEAAGGVPKIDDFCDALLGKASPSASATSTDPGPGPGKPADPGKPTKTGRPTATPSHPAKGPGKETGK